MSYLYHNKSGLVRSFFGRNKISNQLEFVILNIEGIRLEYDFSSNTFYVQNDKFKLNVNFYFDQNRILLIHLCYDI